MNKSKEIAEKILGRELLQSEGIDTNLLEVTEAKLGIKIPQSLKDFYLAVGNLYYFTDAFNSFAKLDQLYIIDGKLMFLEENQGVCYWGLDLKDGITIYQTQDEEKWYAEPEKLDEFLKTVMYYQAANGNPSIKYSTEGEYTLCYMTKISNVLIDNNRADFIIELEKHWEKVVVANGLIIYWHKKGLIWYYINDQNNIIDNIVFLKTRREDDLISIKEKFGFYRL